MLLLFILYGLTAVVALLIGYICLKKRSSYPDVSTGYPLGVAKSGEQAWAYANRCCGLTAAIGGILAFVVVPAVLWLMKSPITWFLWLYFALIILWTLLVLLVPMLLLKRAGKRTTH